MAARMDAEVTEYNCRWASGKYGSSHAGYAPHFVTFMTRAVAARGKSQLRALEIGCGDGYFSGHLIRLGCSVCGVDLSPVAVARAAEMYPQGSFRVHDLAQPLPFDADAFDLVWCSEVLEHLFAPLETAKEIARVLKPGGVLLVTVPYHGLLKNLGIALFAFERHYDPTYPHIRFYTRKSLKGMIEHAGLHVDEIGSCGSNLGLRDWIVRTNILLRARKPTASGASA